MKADVTLAIKGDEGEGDEGEGDEDGGVKGTGDKGDQGHSDGSVGGSSEFKHEPSLLSKQLEHCLPAFTQT